MPEAKRPRGRPPVDNGETERYELRLSKERLAAYTKAAAKADKSLAGWIKGVLDRAAKRLIG
jgi:predicted HicB family RNase H-like nuclease